jgi:hypothetical protein
MPARAAPLASQMLRVEVTRRDFYRLLDDHGVQMRTSEIPRVSCS